MIRFAVPNKPRRNETIEVLKPILQLLGLRGFIVVGGKVGFYAAMMILHSNRNCPGIVWRQNTGASPPMMHNGKRRFIKYGEPGIADIIGILRGGHLLAIEAKLPGGEQSSDQRAFAGCVEAMGGLYILAHSPEEAVAGLKAARAMA